MTRVVVVHLIGFRIKVAMTRELRNGVRDLVIYVLVGIRILLSLSLLNCFYIRKYNINIILIFRNSRSIYRGTNASTNC